MTPLVCHIVYRLDYGGLENGVVNLVNTMPADRYRHAIVCLAGYSGFRHRIRRQDVSVVSLEKREGKDLAAYRRLYQWLRSRRPAIVHTRNVGTVDCQWIAFAARVPGRVHGEHGWEAHDPRGTDPSRLWLRRLCRPVIQAYVPMSRDLAAWLQASVGAPARRIHQAYNGVDVEKFSPVGPRAATPWDACRSSVVVLGTVGRLDPVKNQELLLRAVHRVIESGRDPGGRLRLMIVGQGTLEQRLRETCRSLGLDEKVWFVGARDDVPAMMRAMDVFVLSSINEGISNTVLEAMASGLPVIASNVGGNPELVRAGVTGNLVPEGREDALAEAILAYVTDADARHREGMAGRQRVEAQFSLETMAARYLQIYDRLIGERRSELRRATA